MGHSSHRPSDQRVPEDPGRWTPGGAARTGQTRDMEATSLIDTTVTGRQGPEEAFGALGDPARLAVLRALQGGTTCVCELAPKLNMAPNLLSYHLRILRETGLVEGTKRGRRIEYRVRHMALQELAVELVRLAVGGDEHED